MSYRVEVHDGKNWKAFGIRINPNSKVSEFCGLMFADQFTSQADAIQLRDKAARLCGGTLRVAKVPD